MKLKEISRTATFAWSSSSSSGGDLLPLLATGTVSGALDETFSNVGQLEIWQPNWLGGSDEGIELGLDGGKGPRANVQTTARFNRLAWSASTSSSPRGVLAAGMETGEIGVYDVQKILSGSSAHDSLLFKNEQHTGPVRGLDFNPIQGNLFASGAVNAELYVFDLTSPTKSHSTGPRSSKLEEITSLQWNPVVPHILASSSSSGYTSVWDLRGKKEVISLAYGGGAATGMAGGGGGMQVGGRRGMSDICWQPNTSTRLITASEDDTSPIIMVWDLRNSRAPEKILTGHDKGVLSVSWCKEDPDMLLSCGKDNRTICWNPQTCEIIGELPPSTNWSFQTAWCPRNPDILATASFDGKIGIHTLQSTGEVTTEPAGNKTASVDDIFGGISASYSEEQSKPVMSLKQPPKWLKRPVAASFGFGGRLASASNLPGASGKHQSGVVHLRQIVTETEVVERAKKLEALVKDKEELKSFCGAMTKEAGQDDENAAGWKALYSLFNTNSRDELVTLLGFSKDEIEQQVSEAVKKFKKDSGAQTATDADAAGKEEPATPRDTAVTFAEKTEEVSSPAATEQPTDATKPTSEATPSEFSTTSDATKKTEAETEATEQSLFGEPDDGAIVAVDAGTPAATAAAAADFFSSMGTLRSALPDHVTIPHQGYAKDSSVAATIGSRASSVASDNLKVNTFKIYPSDESEVDRLITRALVLGDFESAVTLSLSVDRFADALVLAVKGGPELLTKTQKAYFERRTAALPYLRLFQSIVSNDLSDVVQNAELSEWKEIFVVLCTFARQDEFNNLAEQLGQRLEFRYKVAHGSEDEKIASRSKELRKDALLCYLAAGKLEKLVKIWLDEMREEEEKRVKASEVSGKGVSRYTAHAAALQTFIEKVTVFKMATGYQDVDLAHPTQSEAAVESGARIYKLAALYDRYYEYADMLASQGLVELAVDYVSATPADYKGAEGNDAGLASARERYMAGAHARKVQAAPVSAPGPFAAARAPQPPAPVGAYGRPTYGKPAVASSAPAAVPPATSTYTAYAAPAPAPVSDISTNPYAGASTSYAQPPQSLQYGAPQASTYGAYGQQQHAAQPAYPPPPPMAKPRPTDQGPPVPAAQRRDIPGWNDAPSIGAPKRPSSASSGGKPMPIMSPFPESQNQVLPPPQSPGVPANVNQPGYFAPPPRAHGPPANLPPPPKATTSRPPPAGPPPRSSSPRAGPPPPGRAGPAPHGMAGPPPPRAMSPLVPPEHRMMSPPMQMQPRPPSANPYVQAPTTAQNAAHAAPAPGPYGPSAGINVPRAGPPPAALRPPASAPAPAAPAAAAPASPVAKAEPPKSKYPPGDRSHIPAGSQTIYNSLAGELSRVKQITPPQQKRFLDDTERRLNILFDLLNCDTVPPDTLAQLAELVKAIAARNSQVALDLHVDMLTRATRSDDFSVWMTGIKQLVRLGMY